MTISEGVTVLAVALVAVLELWPGAAPSSRPAPAARPPAAAPAGPVTPDDAAILARPLFTPSRRPPAAAPPPPPAPPPPEAPPPRLVGVMLSGAGRSAILATPGGRMAVVAEGHSLDGVLVRSVGPDSARVRDARGEHVLRLPAPPVLPMVAPLAAPGPAGAAPTARPAASVPPSGPPPGPGGPPRPGAGAPS